MAKMMKAVQITKDKKFAVTNKDIPQPKNGEALIRIQACGICHSDSMVVEGLWPGIEYPRIPGHEVAGIIEELGSQAGPWKKGQRVGVGWYGGHCTHCDRCRRGDFILCENGLVSGISYDGGYAEYMVAPIQALVKIPDELNDLDAAPLLCAGVTTFNSLRNSGIRPGEKVAVLGIGGLGHLALQYAARSGFETIAIARGMEKESLARELGAHHYIDSQKENISEKLQSLGGANLILGTASNAQVMSDSLGGLAIDGKFMILGIGEEPIKVEGIPFIMGRRKVQGWPSGIAADSEDTLEFSARSNIKPMIEVFPLEKAEEAYQHMMNNRARFRVVLKP
jgi:D-arabinose 1-dehydrogenase-like Zn-dependent alcohol dehydrogenase